MVHGADERESARRRSYGEMDGPHGRKEVVVGGSESECAVAGTAYWPHGVQITDLARGTEQEEDVLAVHLGGGTVFIVEGALVVLGRRHLAKGVAVAHLRTRSSKQGINIIDSQELLLIIKNCYRLSVFIIDYQ